jgi:Fe-S oxidoreductase
MSPIAMSIVLVSTLSFFAWTAARRVRQISIGAPDRDFRLAGGEWFERAKDVALYAFGQKKMPYYRLAGVAHMLVFGGFLAVGLNSLQLWARGYDADFDFWGLLAHDAPLGMAYVVVKDTFVVLTIVGVLVFVYYRVVLKGVDPKEGAHTKRMTLGFEGLLILGIIFTMMVMDLLYWGSWKVLETRAAGGDLSPLGIDWASSLVAVALSSLGSKTLTVTAHIGFWIHSSLVLVFLNILPFSKHFHIITSFPNTFARDRTPPGRLPKVEDLEGKVEREEPVGIRRLEDLTVKHILDLYTCTECGRCSDNCPAFTTGKKLSPKHLTLALRDHLNDTEAAMFGAKDGIEWGLRRGPAQTEDHKEPLHTNPPAPDGYYRSGEPVELVPNIVHPDVIWACTSCRACEEQCPVMISYVDKIIMMRRDQVLIKGEMPSELQRTFNGIETNKNPWNVSTKERAKWADGLEVPLLKNKPDAQVLYWVGCAASTDDRAKKTARAVVSLLKKAEIDFAILGPEEGCTGDPARRAGNEYLFQMRAEANVETLGKYECEKKVILTSCPHCLNTLKNEYPDFGGHYDVVHHGDFLNGLLARGALKPTKRVEGTVAFHDSCYLGRYNEIYESPRKVLESIPGLSLVEVPYWNKNKGLCCGAGGAQMFMEEDKDKRVNVKRTLQLIDTGATTIASGCPFCMTMLTDGLKAHEKDDQIKQLDIAEVLALSVEA